MQAKDPGLIGHERRQRQLAELNDEQRQGAAEQRSVDDVIEQMVEAEPQRSCCGELGVAAADPALREKAEADDENKCTGGEMHADLVRRHDGKDGEGDKSADEQ